MARGTIRLREEYAECRLVGRHQWRRSGRFELDGADLGATYRCGACGTRATFAWNVWSGEMGHKPSYEYPEGYLRTGKGKATRADMRQAAVRVVVGRIGGKRRRAA